MLAEMEECSILMLTYGVCEEKWGLSKSRTEEYLELLKENDYLNCCHTAGKVIIVTAPGLTFDLNAEEPAEYSAVILMSDQDSIEDFNDISFY